jgi:hypothetical protein
LEIRFTGGRPPAPAPRLPDEEWARSITPAGPAERRLARAAPDAPLIRDPDRGHSRFSSRHPLPAAGQERPGAGVDRFTGRLGEAEPVTARPVYTP